jgi:hypothetical protein
MAEKTDKREPDDRGKKGEPEYWIPKTVEELKKRCPEHFDRLMGLLAEGDDVAFVEEFEKIFGPAPAHKRSWLLGEHLEYRARRK